METTINVHKFEQLADRFKLLSAPSRLRILLMLCSQERNVTDICDCTGLNQANVSRHLQQLKLSGAVAVRRVGGRHYYRVIDSEILDLCTQVCSLDPENGAL